MTLKLPKLDKRPKTKNNYYARCDNFMEIRQTADVMSNEGSVKIQYINCLIKEISTLPLTIQFIYLQQW